ncbi:MAG: hypothetical protein K8T91_05410 [Planctomycetes bacterium]|nr:hypothetical protein [Planctomycetota bacterium]
MDALPDSDRTKQSASGPLGGLHFLLIFSAFGLLALVLMGPKYQKRQEDLEQQYSGIRQIQQQEQQRRVGRSEAVDPRFEQPTPASDGKQTLLISLRPLMLTVAVVMLLAWAGLQWRRMQRTNAPAIASTDPSTAHREPTQP